eukprot:m51a1_g146 putative cysteine proteinase rd19a (506) ;mRNA; r:469243-471681
MTFPHFRSCRRGQVLIFSLTRYQLRQEAARKAVFAANLRVIEGIQHEQPEATFGINQFADVTQKEFAQRYLAYDRADAKLPFPAPVVKDDSLGNGTANHDPPEDVVRAGRQLPASYYSPYITPVRNQGRCGSCWAFATTSIVEAAWRKANGASLTLSVEQLLECTSGGCNGGWTPYALQYVQDMSNNLGGLMLESEYVYVGSEDGTCDYRGCRAAASISRWGITSSDEGGAMPQALVTYGMLGVSLNANLLQFYIRGIVQPTSACSSGTNHAVMVTGYDRTSWTVKNSWGAGWGENGYFRIRKGINACNIAANGGRWAQSPTCTASAGGACAYGLEFGNDGFWGNWGALGLCPTNTYATGFATISEPGQGRGDDTAANGVRLYCGDSYTAGPTSLVGPWGSWDTPYGCPPGYYLTEFQLMVENPCGSSCDDTAVNRMRGLCRNAQGQQFTFPGESNSKTSWGSWTQWYKCPSGYAVVGIRTRVEPSQGSGDDTSLNAVRLRCKQL